MNRLTTRQYSAIHSAKEALATQLRIFEKLQQDCNAMLRAHDAQTLEFINKMVADLRASMEATQALMGMKA